MKKADYVKWLRILDEEILFDILVDGKKEVDLHEMISDICELLEQEEIPDDLARQNNCKKEYLTSIGDQEIEEPFEDCVSRAEVLEQMEYLNDGSFAWAMVRTNVAHLKSFYFPKQKVGHWTDNHNGTFKCDVCGCKHSKSNYCPSCGAKMSILTNKR